MKKPMSYSFRSNFYRLALAMLLLLVSFAAHAYIGPGAGISFLQGLWVALVGVALTVLAIIFLPFKLLFRKTGRVKGGLLVAFVGLLIWFFYDPAPAPAPNQVDQRVIVLGFDGMDPQLAQHWMEAGLMPNFARLAKEGSFQALGTSNPPQSPVAWASFASGTGPGEHGIFDFLRRATDSYAPDFSISETDAPEYYLNLFGLQIPTDGGQTRNRRIGVPFWMTAEQNGANAAVLRVPVTFPPDPIHHMLSGMGVPDLLGSQGTYSLFTTERIASGTSSRTKRVRPNRQGLIETVLEGPDDPFATPGNAKHLQQAFSIEPESQGVRVAINDTNFTLHEGQWSDWVLVNFDIGGPLNVSGMVRFHLVQSYPKLRLYVSPIQIDPHDPAVPISSPPEFAAELADRIGLYHTIGMPEETWSLNEEHISDEAYLDMISTILAEREAMWYDTLEAHNTELAVTVFVQTDRVSHMFYRGLDEENVLYPQTSEKARGAIQWIYQEADRVLGETIKRMDENDQLLVLSDHGFAPFRKVVHLNRWLAEQGYLVFKPGQNGTDSLFVGVDWSKTRAYALGLNGIFINQLGREPQGSVRLADNEQIKSEIAEHLRQAQDPETGESLVRQVFDRNDIYPGLANAEAPDLVVGYEKNYRASWQTTLGGTPKKLIELNTQKWSGDHCIDPELVPGVLFTSFPLPHSVANIQDLPNLVLELMETSQND